MPQSGTATALVTGAGKRIGRAMALALADTGYDVAIHYHSSKKEADEVASLIEKKGRTAMVVKADLSKEEDTARLIAETNDLIGPLTLLVNSASTFEHDDIDTMTSESWNRHMTANLQAPVKLAQDFARQALPQANNVIVNLVDQRVLKLTPQFLSYTVSKSTLYSITKTLAQALGPKGIRVNAIGPGPTLKNPRQTDKDWREQNEATILGYGATPDDICAALIYLTHARAVTGQMIAVDGGQHLAWQTPDVLVGE